MFAFLFFVSREFALPRSITHPSLFVLLSLCLGASAIGDDHNRFIGFTETASGTYTAEACGPSYTRFTSMNYACCAAETDSNPLLLVACSAGTVYHQDGSSSKSYFTCSSDQICATKRIYQSVGAADFVLDVNCGAVAEAVLYVTPPAGATVVDSYGNAMVVDGIASTSAGPATFVPGLATPGSSVTQLPAQTSPAAEGGRSAELRKALIAVGVVAIALFVGLVGVAVWFLRLRRKKLAVVELDREESMKSPGGVDINRWPVEMPVAERDQRAMGVSEAPDTPRPVEMHDSSPVHRQSGSSC